MNNVPANLYTPPTSAVNPPVETKKHELPFEELSWQDFEKLCLRVVLLEAQVEDARQYGVQGDDQQGIDIFARIRGSEKYKTYQCKNVQDFGPAKIRAAVRLFRKGNWRSRSNEFVLCTREQLQSKQRSDEVIFQRRLLAKAGIQFTEWDSVALNKKLKDLPEVVDDFFGRAWVKEFCGEEAANTLSNRHRLDGPAIHVLRVKLGAFYENVFKLDAGLPGGADPNMGAPSLAERFVHPDIQESISTWTGPNTQIEQQSSLDAARDKSSDNLRQPSRRTTYQARRPFAQWLSSQKRSVILGDPGSGKSTLARFVVTDLLKEAPQITALAQEWGQYLPIWVPFGYWTRKLAETSTADCSLSELLKAWLKGNEEERLWPLIQQALEDERLLLIVDGLDEWNNADAAKQALRKLQLFIEQRQLPTILTSRPYGFEQLSMPSEGWQIGTLCDFSPSQQQQLAKVWFKRYVEHEFGGLDETAQTAKVEAMTASFVGEVRRLVDLGDLAKVPLLLCLLIAFRIQNKRLPSDRFTAYRDAVTYMIETHPQRRREAAALSSSSRVLENYELRAIFAYLAFSVQSEQSQGVIEIEAAKGIVEDFLHDENRLGLEIRKAKQLSHALITIGDQNTGLLTRKSPTQVGFFHRVFQEYLAAEHLNTLPEIEQLEVLEKQGANRQWRETILSLFSLTSAPDKVRRMVENLDKAGAANHVAEYNVAELLSEVAFGPFGCPANLAKQLAERAFERIEYAHYAPHAERMMERVLFGLRSARLKDRASEKVRSWFPRRQGMWEGLLRNLGTWERKPDVEQSLWRAMFDEEASYCRAAAKAYAALCQGDVECGDQIAELSLNAVNPSVRTAALEGLLEGWPNHPKAEQSVDSACSSLFHDLRIFGHIGKVLQGRQASADMKALLYSGKYWQELSLSYRDSIADALIKGWPGSLELRRECFALAGRILHRKLGSSDGHYLAETVGAVLLKNYSQDDVVARFVAWQIRHRLRQTETKNYSLDNLLFNLHGKEFELLNQNFKDHPIVVEAVEAWLTQAPDYEHRIFLGEAVLIGRTPTGKALLLENATEATRVDWPNLPAQALLDGWGMDDIEVKELLTNLAYGPSDKAGNIAYNLPNIIADKDACRKRLVELLADESCRHKSGVLVGLNKLGVLPKDTEVTNLLFSVGADKLLHDERYEEALAHLVIDYSFDPRVRPLALQMLQKSAGQFAAIAKTYEKDPEIRSRILNLATPISANLRRVIATHLRDGSGNDAFDLELLKLYDYDSDAATMTIASCGYHQRMRSTLEEDAIQSLSAGLAVRMPYGHEKGMAAFSGILTMNRLDILQVYSRDQHYFWTHDNTPFVELILANWQYIEHSLGYPPVKLLSLGNDAHEFWDLALPLIDDYPIARAEALKFIRNKKELGIIRDEVLLFLNRVGERELLLDFCLDELDLGQPYLAAELIGQHFAGDKKVLNRILGTQWEEYQQRLQQDDSEVNNLKHSIRKGQIAALCEGWPSSSELSHVLDVARRERWRLEWSILMLLTCTMTCTPKTDPFERLESQPKERRDENPTVERGTDYRPVTAGGKRRDNHR